MWSIAHKRHRYQAIGFIFVSLSWVGLGPNFEIYDALGWVESGRKNERMDNYVVSYRAYVIKEVWRSILFWKCS